MPRRSARVSKANATPTWKLPLPWERMDAEDARRDRYLKARDDLGHPPLRTAEDLHTPVAQWETRPVLEGWYWDPDAAVRRFALWLEIEETRREIFDVRAKGLSGRIVGLEGFGPDGNLLGMAPREVRIAPFLRTGRRRSPLTGVELASMEAARERLLDELAKRVARFGFVVSAGGVVDAGAS